MTRRQHHRKPGGNVFSVNPEPDMSVTTIIVNYNAGEVLRECVEALLESSVRSRVVVVDNASSDKSAENLFKLFRNNEAVKIHFNAVNLGFAPAVNSVARTSEKDWLLILNPDCIVETETLGNLLDAMESDKRAALAGPVVLDEKGVVQRATLRRFPDPWKSLMATSGLWRLGKWFPALQGIELEVSKLTGSTQACEAVSGACMLIRRSALEEVGYLDEKYAMHCEDLDLMFRFRQEGWHCLFVPQARCVHKQGLSSRSRPSWVHFQKHRGMARFFGKFQARSTFLPFRILVYMGIWLRFIFLWPLILIRR
jgi:GT2 family glycosyltransferase